MNLTDKNKYKSDFKKELDTFSDKLEKYVSTDNGGWTVKGFIDVYKNIYTISSDTKIVSKILEIHIFPQILQFAESIGYKIILEKIAAQLAARATKDGVCLLHGGPSSVEESQQNLLAVSRRMSSKVPKRSTDRRCGQNTHRDLS